jgi:outer membrane immunogenic protein
MNKLLIAAVSLFALAVPAVAADMAVKAPVYKAPIAPASDWSGFYLGGHAGFMWGRTTVWEDGDLFEKNARTNGFVGGALAGVNWQNGAWVLGLEGDFGWTDAHGTGIIELPVNHYDFNWTSHIRGRVGYATSNVLWFVAAGLAVANFDYTQGESGITASGLTFTGWTLGGGVDIAITRNWIARVEYLHDDFGSKNFVIDSDPYRVKLTGDTVRGALMYKF